jgi:beta-glucosidase-like glycosyl hydrolase
MTYTANVSARDQVEYYWPAFRAAVQGGNVTSIMCTSATKTR